MINIASPAPKSRVQSRAEATHLPSVCSPVDHSTVEPAIHCVKRARGRHGSGGAFPAVGSTSRGRPETPARRTAFSESNANRPSDGRASWLLRRVPRAVWPALAHSGLDPWRSPSYIRGQRTSRLRTRLDPIRPFARNSLPACCSTFGSLVFQERSTSHRIIDFFSFLSLPSFLPPQSCEDGNEASASSPYSSCSSSSIHPICLPNWRVA